MRGSRADDVPLVIGCGPVGLSVIASLKIRNVHPIIAADFSPGRRALALRMGADIVVDPGDDIALSELDRTSRRRPAMTAAATRSCSAAVQSSALR